MLTGQRLCQSKSHQDSVLSALNQQRKDGLLCDVTLVAGEQKFHAHKAVLAACSDYFRVRHNVFPCIVNKPVGSPYLVHKNLPQKNNSVIIYFL